MRTVWAVFTRHSSAKNGGSAITTSKIPIIYWDNKNKIANLSLLLEYCEAHYNHRKRNLPDIVFQIVYHIPKFSAVYYPKSIPTTLI